MDSEQYSSGRQFVASGSGVSAEVQDSSDQRLPLHRQQNNQTDLRLDAVSFQQQDMSLFMRKASDEVRQMTDDMIKAQMDLALEIAAATLELSRRDLERQAEEFSQKADEMVQSARSITLSESQQQSDRSDASAGDTSGQFF